MPSRGRTSARAAPPIKGAYLPGTEGFLRDNEGYPQFCGIAPLCFCCMPAPGRHGDGVLASLKESSSLWLPDGSSTLFCYQHAPNFLLGGVLTHHQERCRYTTVVKQQHRRLSVGITEGPLAFPMNQPASPSFQAHDRCGQSLAAFYSPCHGGFQGPLLMSAWSGGRYIRFRKVSRTPGVPASSNHLARSHHHLT